MLIAICGIDASGKATQVKLLVEALQAHDVEARSMSFPNYKTETGMLIKKMLQQKRRLAAFEDYVLPGPLQYEEAIVLQSLMMANRYEAINVLSAGKTWRLSPPNGTSPPGVLVLDRYWASGYAYGVADGLDPGWLVSVHRALPQPDLTVLCDVTVEESFRRRPVREDAYETSRERLKRARENYKQLAQYDPPQRWFVTEENGTVDRVHTQIMDRVKQCFVEYRLLEKEKTKCS